MEILVYQIAIFVGIIISTLLFGKAGRSIALVIAVIWTVVMLFMPWLMILQLFTVLIAYVISEGMINSPGFKKNQDTAWSGIVVVIAIGYFFYSQISKNSAPKAQEQGVTSNERQQLTAPMPARVESPPRVPVANTPVSERLDRAIARLESDFPELNPKSPQFNQGLVDYVIERQKYLISTGISPDVAIEQSAREAMAYEHERKRRVAAQQEQVRESQTSKINIKHHAKISPSADSSYGGSATMQDLRNNCRPPYCRNNE